MLSFYEIKTKYTYTPIGIWHVYPYMYTKEYDILSSIKELFFDETKRNILFITISAIALLVSFFDLWHFPVDAAWVSIVLCGLPIIKEAAEGLITEFDIKADVLVAIALIASVIIGEEFAAGEIACIMQIGALLEDMTVAKARAGIERLVHLTPRTARVVRDGKEHVIPAEQVKVGDIVRVLAGETIAVDGLIISGQTSVDQSIMTGESMPVDRSVGDDVSSGTVNQFGAFDMKATKVGEDSSLQRMIRLVQSADAGKAKIVGLTDKWATWIVLGAVSSAIVTWLITGEVLRAVTILVVFCPCALVLATPTAIMAAIGNATKYGILVREGDALERLAQVKRIAFDKTGTLTYGRPEVVAVRSFSSSYPDDKLYALASSAELRSEHPLGKAIVNSFRKTGGLPVQPEKFTMVPGRGVLTVVDGMAVCAGNAELLADQGLVMTDAIRTEAYKFMSEGSTVIYIGIDKELVGFIALSDVMRENAVTMVSETREIGLTPMVLTGDHKEAASHIANAVGISEYHAECLPVDKLTVIDNIQKRGELLCMVGDGVNDAPALKIAHVGVAMGGMGSDIAIEAADIVLVGDDIGQIPHLLALSKKMMKTINLNVMFSLALNFIAIILAMAGTLTPVVGALVHNAGAVVVIINSAMLLKWTSKR